MARNRSVLGWVIYDFAAVVFAMNVAGLYFPLWVVEDAGGRDAHVAVALSAAMAIVLVAAPLLGSFADRSGHRVLMLGYSTAACALCTLFLGHGGLIVALIVFAIANALNGCGLVFYDALLPVVSTNANRGRISGYGIGAGFGGAILGGPIGAIAAGRASDRIGPRATIVRVLWLWVGVLTLCASIPAFGLPRELFWIVAPLGGVAFGGTGAADRALLLAITPPEHAGRFFSVFAMVGRFSAIIGPLIWALTVDVLRLGRPIAVATLAVMVLTTLYVFRGLPDSLANGALTPLDSIRTSTLKLGTSDS